MGMVGMLLGGLEIGRPRPVREAAVTSEASVVRRRFAESDARLSHGRVLDGLDRNSHFHSTGLTDVVRSILPMSEPSLDGEWFV